MLVRGFRRKLLRPPWWPWRLAEMGEREWRKYALALLPAQLWLKSDGLRRLGIRATPDDGRLRFVLPGGEILYHPLCDGPDYHHLRELLLAHWLYVTVLDQYRARRYIRPGMVVIDVGANVGAFTLLASRLVGPHGRVVAIEPVPENAACLRRAISDNGLANVTVAQVALGSVEGEITLSADPGRLGAASAVFDRGPARIAARLATLDSLAEELSLRRVDFIKIDVEGYEPEVLLGAPRVLAELTPTVVAAAYHLPEHRSLLPEFLSQLGYRTRIVGAGTGLERHCLAVPETQPAD